MCTETRAHSVVCLRQQGAQYTLLILQLRCSGLYYVIATQPAKKTGLIYSVKAKSRTNLSAYRLH